MIRATGMDGELIGRRILFVVNNPDFFLSHRRDLGRQAKALGMEVHVATPRTQGWAEVVGEGFSFHPVAMSRSRGLVWQELRTLLALIRLCRRIRPDIVHNVTVKPVLYGSMAARFAPGSAVVNAISGLGTVFIADGWLGKARRAAVVAVYRLAFAGSRQVAIFQNPDDEQAFVRAKILRRGTSAIIKGSGVDPNRFRPRPEPEGMPVVVLVSRMLRDKGVAEFAAAAASLKSEGVLARFALVGDIDPGNPTSIPVDTLRAWEREGAVEWWGHRSDIPEVLASSHIACLPSYREGLPKSLIEAAAAGRPIVTTDVPGCREIVRNGHNGILVPARDIAALAQALKNLIEDRTLRVEMGMNAREVFESGFSLRAVVDATMELYRARLREGR